MSEAECLLCCIAFDAVQFPSFTPCYLLGCASKRFTAALNCTTSAFYCRRFTWGTIGVIPAILSRYRPDGSHACDRNSERHGRGTHSLQYNGQPAFGKLLTCIGNQFVFL